MKVVVTGCAGFVGSHLAEACLDRGDDVVGIDSLTDYYDVDQKRDNIATFADHERFRLLDDEIADCIDDAVDGADVVYHQAGQPGVRASWRTQFDDYVARNVVATQRLLEASLGAGVGRIVYASSSSIYGNADHYPVVETMLPKPFSPYGVTKLAAEHLGSLYAANFGLPVVSLRYFTVYGPRQRPDMAMHRLFEAALHGHEFPLFGSGEQLRDFTYVGDVVAANLCAGAADVEPGLVANVAGGGSVSMIELIALVEEITGRTVRLDRRPGQDGDVRRTGGSVEVAERELGWSPATSLRSGLEQQLAWHVARADRTT